MPVARILTLMGILEAVKIPLLHISSRNNFSMQTNREK
jgi:hypothetical protein